MVRNLPVPGRLVEGTSSPAETPRPVTAYNKSPDARPGWRRLAGAAGRVKQSPSNIVNAAGVCFASRYHFAWGGSDELENETGFRRARCRRGPRRSTERGTGAGALLCRVRLRLPVLSPVPGILSPLSAAAADLYRAAAGLLRAAAGRVP